jgi:hypothetical protein
MMSAYLYGVPTSTCVLSGYMFSSSLGSRQRVPIMTRVYCTKDTSLLDLAIPFFIAERHVHTVLRCLTKWNDPAASPASRAEKAPRPTLRALCAVEQQQPVTGVSVSGRRETWRVSVLAQRPSYPSTYASIHERLVEGARVPLRFVHAA